MIGKWEKAHRMISSLLGDESGVLVRRVFGSGEVRQMAKYSVKVGGRVV